MRTRPINHPSVPRMYTWATLLVIAWIAIAARSASGSIFSDYTVHVFGDFYLFHNGGIGSTLTEKASPVDDQDKAERFDTICEAVASYNHQESTIYGGTYVNDFFIIVAPKTLQRFRLQKDWAAALQARGITDLALIVPHPPQASAVASSKLGSALFVSLLLLPTGLFIYAFLQMRHKAPLNEDAAVKQ